MVATRITQIFNNASPLQTHRQDSFYITRHAFALCAEAALTPQYSLTHNALGKIVGWLHTLIAYKCSKVLAMFNNPATFATQRRFTFPRLFKKFFHTLHQRRHPVLKRQIFRADRRTAVWTNFSSSSPKAVQAFRYVFPTQ